jgi:hypothetical protein
MKIEKNIKQSSDCCISMSSIIVTERVLHVKYQNTPEQDIIKCADEYEGQIPDRIGFNFPMYVVKKVFPHHPYLQYPADYVICYQENDKKGCAHELLHAKFYLDKKYKHTITKLWDKLNPIKRLKVEKQLKEMGYPESVWLDEFQAYLFTEKKDFFRI